MASKWQNHNGSTAARDVVQVVQLQGHPSTNNTQIHDCSIDLSPFTNHLLTCHRVGRAREIGISATMSAIPIATRSLAGALGFDTGTMHGLTGHVAIVIVDAGSSSMARSKRHIEYVYGGSAFHGPLLGELSITAGSTVPIKPAEAE